MNICTFSFIGLALVGLAACAKSEQQTFQVKAETDETPEDLWAALAFGVEWLEQGTRVGNNHFGRAFGEKTELIAKDTAIGACAFEGCETRSYVNVGCIGIAEGSDSDLIHWFGWGAAHFKRSSFGTASEQKSQTRLMAGEIALSGCGGGTLDRQCQVQEIFCTWDAKSPSSAEAIQAWITEMGGAQAEGVDYTFTYLTRAAEPMLRNGGLSYQQARCVVGRHWARLNQLAVSCNITVNNLDRFYSLANNP